MPDEVGRAGCGGFGGRGGRVEEEKATFFIKSLSEETLGYVVGYVSHLSRIDARQVQTPRCDACSP